MRLAYCGNFEPEQSTENHWKWAFEQHGVEVVPVQQNRATIRDWEHTASECDAATLSTTWGWPLPCSTGVWDRLNRRGVRTFTLHLDLVMGIPREHELLTRGRHPQFFGAEQVWTSDGSHDEQWAALGVDHRWLPPAIHAPNAILGTSRPEWECDVVFAGSCSGYHPEWPRRKQLVEAARTRWGDRFRTVGGDWGNAVRGPALADVYASARVVLGDSLCPGFENDRYFSDRVPETAGRGGVLVHPRNAASEFFRDCAAWTDSWDVDAQLDRVEKVIDATPDIRASARATAHAAVVAHHTYTVRAREILDALGFPRED